MTNPESRSTGPSGLFVIDLQSLKLSTEQLQTIDLALQEAVQREIAKLDDTEGMAGGPIGGIAGYITV